MDWLDPYNRKGLKEQQDRLKNIQASPEGRAAFNTQWADISNMRQTARQARMQGDLKRGKFGSSLVSLMRGARSVAQSDKFKAMAPEEIRDDPEKMNAFIQKYYEDNPKELEKANSADAVAMAGEALAQNMGDIAGQGLKAGAVIGEGASAAAAAGLMTEAQNYQAQKAAIAQGNEQAAGMNLEARGQAAQMTDGAIAQANAFDAGMQGIGMSGIEGSANMERNLQYGQDSADAAEQLAFDAQNRQAQGLSNGLVNTFSDLSQNKAAAIGGAWSNAMEGARAEDFALAQETSNAELAAQPTPNDYEKAFSKAEEAMGPPKPEIVEQRTVTPAAQAEELQIGGAGAQTPAAPAVDKAVEDAFAKRMAKVDISGIAGVDMNAARTAYASSNPADWENFVRRVNNAPNVKNKMGFHK